MSTLGCGSLALDGACALALRHGLEGIELRALAGTLDLPPWLEAQFGNPAALTQLACLDGLRTVAIDTSFKLVGATPDERAALLRYVPWAEAMGAKHLRVFDGGCRYYDPVEMAEAMANLAWWRLLRAEQDWTVDLMVETHDSLLTAGQITRFVTASDGVPILWDSHHTWRKGGEDPIKTWAAIRRDVVHVHVKDSFAGAYVLPGTGEFPMALLREVLVEEFTGTVSLEWEKWWHPHLPDLDLALATANNANWW